MNNVNIKKDNTQISATEFKKHFLSLIDDVKNKHSSFVITKRKIPVARILPLETSNNVSTKSYYGSMKGTTKINEDIISYSSELDWEINND